MHEDEFEHPPSDAEYSEIKKGILREAEGVVWSFRTLANERNDIVKRNPGREASQRLIAAELGAYRKIYTSVQHEINELFERLGWPMEQAGNMLSPNIDGASIVKVNTPVRFVLPANLQHRVVNADGSVDSTEYSQSPGGYGIFVEHTILPAGQQEIVNKSHDATEDEVYALAELMSLIQQEYQALYRQFEEKQ